MSVSYFSIAALLQNDFGQGRAFAGLTAIFCIFELLGWLLGYLILLRAGRPVLGGIVGVGLAAFLPIFMGYDSVLLPGTLIAAALVVGLGLLVHALFGHRRAAKE